VQQLRLRVDKLDELFELGDRGGVHFSLRVPQVRDDREYLVNVGREAMAQDCFSVMFWPNTSRTKR